MKSLGKCFMNLVNPKNGEEYKTEFVVVEDNCTPLLCSKSVQQMNLVEVKYENNAVVYEEMGKIQMGLTMQKISEDYEDVLPVKANFKRNSTWK